MENLLKNLENLRENALKTMRLLEIERKRAEAHSWKAEIAKPDFWNDRTRAVAVSQKADETAKEVLEWDDLQAEIRSLEELVAEAGELNDDSLDKEAHEQYEKLKARYEKLEFYALFCGKHDAGNAILSLHAGTGGVDAQDWAQILERMFLRFAEKMKWKAELIDRTLGNEAGIKSATYSISCSLGLRLSAKRIRRAPLGAHFAF